MAGIPAFQLGSLDSPKDAPEAVAVLALSSSITPAAVVTGLSFIPAPVVLFGTPGSGGGDAVGYAG